jgi:hypothetical protein
MCQVHAKRQTGTADVMMDNLGILTSGAIARTGRFTHANSVGSVNGFDAACAAVSVA